MLYSDTYYYYFKVHPFLSGFLNIFVFTNNLFSINACQALNFSPISIFNAHINMSGITLTVARIVANILSLYEFYQGEIQEKY